MSGYDSGEGKKDPGSKEGTGNEGDTWKFGGKK